MNHFGQKIPVRNQAGEIVGERPAEVSRITRNGLSGAFGPDRDRKLVVTMRDGDIIAIRPHGTRREVTVAVGDLYGTLLRWQANRVNLEKARDRKAAKAAKAEARRIRAADQRIRAAAKKANE